MAQSRPERYKTALLIGAPGSGKGTQGRILGTIPGFWHFSCGDMFRQLNPNSELGQIFLAYSSRGDLVPDDVTVKMWNRTIHAHTMLGSFKPDTDLLILDGIPRTLEQARLMDEHIDVLTVIHLTCSDEDAMIERLRRRALKENRIDDANDAVIRRRWRVYEAETAPVIGHYDPSIIAAIDATASPGCVLHDVLDVLVPIQDRHFQKFDG